VKPTILKLSFILLLSAFAAAQVPAVPCCDCNEPERSDLICLSAKGMRDHVDHIEPLKPSGLGKGLNLSGTVVLEVRFEPNGKVACVRAKSGHPIAISAAMQAVPKWTFKPAESNGVAKSGCGLIRIKYRLRDKGSSTELK